MTAEGSGVFGMSTVLVSTLQTPAMRVAFSLGGEGKKATPWHQKVAMTAASEAVSTSSVTGWG